MTVCHACKTPLGFFGFADNGTLVHYELFSNHPTKAADAYAQTQQERFTTQLSDYDVRFDEQGLAFFRQQMRALATALGFVSTERELAMFLVRFCHELSSQLLKGSISRDKLLVQAFHALEQLMEMRTMLQERLYEWYSLHFPGVAQQNLAQLIAEHGRREHFPGFTDSHGATLTDDDEAQFRRFATLLLSMEKEQNVLESYVRSLCRELMPNVCSLVDELLAARLLGLTGSLERLARMPASSIQLLGAEKALFRHLKNRRERAPKYGIIFLSSWVQRATAERRGQVARLLAAKLMIASRIDYYSGRLDETLRKDLDGAIR